jgi:hypothetical protein
MDEVTLTFTTEELRLMRNYLRARSAYKPYGEVLGQLIWKPYMETLLNKLENTIDD